MSWSKDVRASAQVREGTGQAVGVARPGGATAAGWAEGVTGAVAMAQAGAVRAVATGRGEASVASKKETVTETLAEKARAVAQALASSCHSHRSSKARRTCSPTSGSASSTSPCTHQESRAGRLVGLVPWRPPNQDLLCEKPSRVAYKKKLQKLHLFLKVMLKRVRARTPSDGAPWASGPGARDTPWESSLIFEFAKNKGNRESGGKR